MLIYKISLLSQICILCGGDSDRLLLLDRVKTKNEPWKILNYLQTDLSNRIVSKPISRRRAPPAAGVMVVTRGGGGTLNAIDEPKTVSQSQSRQARALRIQTYHSLSIPTTYGPDTL